MKSLLILGIESSCDETATAIYDSEKGLIGHQVFSQIDLHKKYGGVVPELASRDHIRKLLPMIDHLLKETEKSLGDIDAIAYTAGPGLSGALLVGSVMANGLAFSLGIPSVPIHHMEAHLLAPLLEQESAKMPFIALLVSGGHTLLVLVKSKGEYELVGQTLDDAAGEAFDKAARLLGLQQPGGPAIEEAAIKGDVSRFDLPRPLLDREDCNFSFSGLKTALMRKRNELTEKQGGLFEKDVSDLSASFQQAMHDVIIEKSIRAIDLYSKFTNENQSFAIAGGVAANEKIRHSLQKVCKTKKIDFLAPPLELCTDNAAIIAYAAAERFFHGDYDDTTISARPRWPLDNQKPAILGSGKKGSKA